MRDLDWFAKRWTAGCKNVTSRNPTSLLSCYGNKFLDN